MDDHFKHIVRTLLSGLAPKYGTTWDGDDPFTALLNIVGVEDDITWLVFVKRMNKLFEKHPFKRLSLSRDIKEELSSIQRTIQGEDIASRASQETATRKKMRTAYSPANSDDLPTHSLQSVSLKMMTNRGRTLFAQRYVDKESADHAIENASQCIALISKNSEDGAENDLTLFTDDVDRITLLQHFKTSVSGLFGRVYDDGGPTDAFHTVIGEKFEREANMQGESRSTFWKIDVDSTREMRPILIKKRLLKQLSMTDPFVRSTTFNGFECFYRSKDHVVGADDIGIAFCVTGVSTNQPAECPPLFNKPEEILKRMRALYGYQMLDDIDRYRDRPDLFPIIFPEFNLEEEMGCTLPRDIFPDHSSPQLEKMKLFEEMKALWETHLKEKPVWNEERKDEFKRIIREDWIQGGPSPVESTTATALVGPTPKQAVEAYCDALVETQTDDQLKTLVEELQAL